MRGHQIRGLWWSCFLLGNRELSGREEVLIAVVINLCGSEGGGSSADLRY